MPMRLRIACAVALAAATSSAFFAGCEGDSCPNGLTECDGECVYLHAQDNCGACGVVCKGGTYCTDGECTCTYGERLCGEVCVDVRDANNCGACGNACALDEECGTYGSCEKRDCDHECDGTCTDILSAHDHCGSCDTACADGEVCRSGRCESSCEYDVFIDCDGSCVAYDSDEKNCGSCGHACDTLAGETCDDGECVDRCESVGRTRCGGNCVDLEDDLDNCGACNTVCDAGFDCAEGQCLANCEPFTQLRCGTDCVELDEENCGECGFECFEGSTCVRDGIGYRCSSVCDGLPGDDFQLCDGDCHDLAADPEHCGDCDTVCDDGIDCVGGVCCLADSVCDGECVDLQTNEAYCGDCDTACGQDELCDGGECVCPAGETLCGDRCRDLEVEELHCGNCDTVCQLGATCELGICTCPVDETDCVDACADLDEDEDHCGACDVACNPGQLCVDGACGCTEGQTVCNGVCKDLDYDDANCGGCGVVCPPTSSCLGGTCGLPLTCEQNFTLPTGCDVFPVVADACGTPVLTDTTTWSGADITTTQTFSPSPAWRSDELVRISGVASAPNACCGGGVVSLGFQTADDRLQTWTQFVSPNDGVSQATPDIHEVGSAFSCSQPDHAIFGATGDFAFEVERYTMNGDFNGGGGTLASATPLALDGDGEVCAHVCGVHKAQCVDESRQYYAATIPPHRALAIDYGVKEGLLTALEVYEPTGEFVCNAVGAVVTTPGYVFYGSRIANHSDAPAEVVLAPVSISGANTFNIAVGLEDDFVP